MAQIVRAENGWILVLNHDGDQCLVFMDDDRADHPERVSFADMINALADVLDLRGSRHDSQRVICGVEPGDKHILKVEEVGPLSSE